MLSQTQILEAMQFTLPPGIPAVHTSGAPRYVMTYQFAGTEEPADFNEVTGTDYTGWSLWQEAEKAAFRAALAHIETFLNIDFREVTGQADPDMNVGRVDIPGSTIGTGGFSYSYFPTSIARYDTMVVFDKTYDLTDAMDLYLHEVGHALGLKHPFEGGATLPAEYDSNKYTVMSYTTNPETGQASKAMQLFDILALQQRWGAADHNSGNTTYTGPRNGPLDCIWDTGGVDLLDASARGNAVALDLREGFFSRFGGADDMVIAFGVQIERAAGSAFDDRITGNALANLLDGNGGHDVIFGGAGRDRLQGEGGRDRLAGGRGNDSLAGGAQRDTFVFEAGSGRDVIEDFQTGVDRILLRGYGFADAAEALAFAGDTASGLRFAFADGAVLTVLGVLRADIEDQILV